MAKRTHTRSGRFYTWGTGAKTERYWSVTTILKALPKDALKWWAAKTTAEEAVDRSATWMTMDREEAVDWLKRAHTRTSSSAAAYGTAVHAAAESYALGKPVKAGEWTEEERKAMGHLLDFLGIFRPTVIAAESPVFNRAQKYAGQLDLIAEVPIDRLDLIRHPWTPREGRDTVTLLIDYKTGGDVDEDKGVYSETALQLNAYGRAEFVGMPNGFEQPLPTIDGLAALQVQAAGWRLWPVRMGEDIFKSFLYVREVFRWLEEGSKEAIGAPVGRPPAETLEGIDITPPRPGGRS